MSDVDATNLIPADEPVYDLRLTAAELKVTYTAVKAYFDGFGHEEREVQDIARAVLAKLPGEHEIRAIDLDDELRKIRELRETR
ncbi:MAG TPA: hypothetical protein VMT10_03510 [Solirubrobacteraceae bacterium]|nr:hypothetical protein [Solirubrobacteraceae bacterium]